MSKKPANIRRSTLGSTVFSRQLKVYFYTSNLEKLLQARLMFHGQGQTLSHFRANREPYEEDYSLPKDELLRRAIMQVRNQFLVRSIFFVEDTSIRIDALSNINDFPGLRAKEWFAETNFSQLDELLKSKGTNRRAIVKSDIALHIPNLEETFMFHGETVGIISDVPPNFETNLQHPWLTPNTFNGWIVPDGADIPLGEMPFEKSIEYDFRIKALRNLLNFLRPLNAAANLPSSFFNRDLDLKNTSNFEPYLPHIFDSAEENSPTVICIIGHKCAGKTTASEFVQSNFGAAFFEASDQLRATAKDLGIEITSSVSARKFLEENGHDAVAQQIIDQVSSDGSSLTVISGLRTIEELELIYQVFDNILTLQISADRRIRFERHIRRGRDSDVKTAEQFSQMDQDQISFGLLQVADEISDISIINESDLSSYYSRVKSSVRNALVYQRDNDGRPYRLLSELHRSLIALSTFSRIASCEEISFETEQLGAMVWRYNTNRALKSIPLFVDRFDKGEDLLSYRINSRGERLLALLNKNKNYNQMLR